MTKPPLILVAPDVQLKGAEFGDFSTSLSMKYEQALMAAGTMPLTMPATISRELIRHCVSRCDGVLFTGGEDVDTRLYDGKMPTRLRRKVNTTPDNGARDMRELLLVDEVFRQRKPLLGICRGHQVVNVALGGTLLADIPSQVPRAVNHRRMDKRGMVVHEVRLTANSNLAKITGRRTLGVNSTHHQAVARVAAPLTATAVSPDGIVEGLELKPEAAGALPFFLTVQFHPERLAVRHPEHQSIFNAFARACALNSKTNL
jgi:putative glutamine amidotransferase